MFNSLTLDLFECDSRYVEILKSYKTGGFYKESKIIDELLEKNFLEELGFHSIPQANNKLTKLRQNAKNNKKGRIGFMRLSLTEKCNMGCTYCFQQKIYEEFQPALSVEKFTNIMNWFIMQNQGEIAYVQYFGGEPLLQFHLLEKGNELLQKAKDEGVIKNYHQTITTNGTLITKKRAEFLVKSNFDVIFSLDGWKTLNDENRVFKNGKGTYDHVMRGLNYYKEAGGRVSFLITPKTENLPSLKKIVDFFVEELKAVNIGFNSPQPTADGWEVDGLGLAKIVQDVWRYCNEKNVDFHAPGTFIPNMLKYKQPQVDRCIDGNNGKGNGDWPVYISADGSVSYCVVHHQDERVVSEDMNHILEENKFRSWHFNESMHDECDGCIANQICGGPCSLELTFRNGNLNPDRCSFFKNMVEWVIKQ